MGLYSLRFFHILFYLVLFSCLRSQAEWVNLKQGLGDLMCISLLTLLTVLNILSELMVLALRTFTNWISYSLSDQSHFI